jgi:LCP family protein required for cell wall assembly
MGLNLGGRIWEAGTQTFSDEPDLIIDEDYLDDEDLASDAEEIDPDTIVWPEHPGYGRREEDVYNILLLGEEAIDSGISRGRTDLIIIATLNKHSKSIKLTSLMRDTLVQIPGYKENKLNSAYEKGDVDLLYETISLNFNIHLDGCVLVNFENFEQIIDYMGGLDLTLTSSEAKYLRNTNYISNPSYRTVVEGKQLMNGNQVLGYSRIRKRAAITGENNDYGRTDRHRIILNAIFDKYKNKSELELATTMVKVLPMVKTDIDSKTFEKLLSTFIEMRTMEINQLRIPANGTFTDNVKVRGMDVLVPDLGKNVSILHEFIFGN